MREPKCPFCNSELVGTIGHPYCRNKKCEMFHEPMSMELLDLLDRTRKALDMAKNAIESAKDHNVVNCVVRTWGNDTKFAAACAGIGVPEMRDLDIYALNRLDRMCRAALGKSRTECISTKQVLKIRGIQWNNISIR